MSTDSDSTALMDIIDTILRSANWEFNVTGNPIMFEEKAGIIAASGISLHVPEEHKTDWGPAIVVLRDALVAEGIPTLTETDTAEAEQGKKRDRIHVMIGSKPLN